MLKSVRKTNIFVLLGMFCIIYYPPILSNVNVMHIVGLISIFYLLINIGYTKSFLSKRIWLKLYLGFLIIAVYILLISTLNSNPISEVANSVYFMFDVLPFSLVLCIYGKKNNVTIKDYINIMFLCGIVQALLALLAFVFPVVQEYFVARLVEYGYASQFTYLSKYRIYGYAAGLTFATPVLQTILALMIVFREEGKKHIDYLLAGLLFFSAVINARVSIVLLLVGIVVFVFWGNLSTSKKIIISGSVVLLSISFFVLLLPQIEKYSSNTYSWIIEGVNEIKALFVGNRMNSAYVGYVINPEKWRLPEKMINVFFGEGHITTGMQLLHGYSSDIGYINDIWLGGIVYVFFTYLFYLRQMWRLKQNENKVICYLGTALLFFFPILNIKGVVCGMSNFTNLMFLVVGITLIDWEDSKNESVFYKRL